jgi:galactokinase
MDPVSILMGGLIKLDCQTLKFERLRSIPETHCLVVMDTGVPRTLAASGYAERVAEIEQIEALNPAIANRQRLAQLDAQTADLVLENLDAPVLKARACHIFTEQTRVEKSALALADRDLVQLGHLMNESHRSLSEDYQVSCDALDHITQISRDSGYALGARMTGAGFGGCAIALVPKVDADRHNAAVEEAYQLHTGLKPALLVAEPGGSAHIVAI